MENIFKKFLYSKKKLDNILQANNSIPNTVRYWMDSDSEHRFIKRSTPEQKSTWEGKVIEYRFNNFGFRTDDDFDSNAEGIVCLGCSFTQGIGLPIEYTWGYKLSKYFNSKFYNLGQGGKSLQTAFRLLLGHSNNIKFDKVFLFAPPQYRDEFIVEDNELLKLYLSGADKDKFILNTLGNQFYQHIFFKMEDKNYTDLIKAWIFGSRKNNILNYIRTVYAIKGLCDHLGVEFYFLTFDEFNTEDKKTEANTITDKECPHLIARDDHWSAKQQHLIFKYFRQMYEDNNRREISRPL